MQGSALRKSAGHIILYKGVYEANAIVAIVLREYLTFENLILFLLLHFYFLYVDLNFNRIN